MIFDHIDWDDANLEHATRHGVSADEIEQAIRNATIWRPNRSPDRSGDYLVKSRTDSNRRVIVVVAFYPDRHTVRPITAWGGT